MKLIMLEEGFRYSCECGGGDPLLAAPGHKPGLGARSAKNQFGGYGTCLSENWEGYAQEEGR